MKTILESPREIPVIAEPEVLVVGAGPAGMGAALASARNGARTMLLEQYGFPGGNLTTAMINPIFTFHDRKGRQLIRGIAGEIVDRLVKEGFCRGHVSDLTFDNASMTPFDPEGMKIVLLDMIGESGCRLRLHSQVAEVIREGNRVKAVILESKSGREAILPQNVIDCTGDGDVAARAGCPFLLGDGHKGCMQPVSLFFRIGGVDDAKLRSWMKENRSLLKDSPTDEEIDAREEVAFLGLHDEVSEAMKRDEYPCDAAARILFYQLPNKDQVTVNATRLQNIDGTNADDLTSAEVETRRQAWNIFRFLQRRVGGFEKSFILDTGSMVGIRETRHFQTDYQLTQTDVLTEKAFEDGIACGSFAIDIHPPTGEKQIFTGGGRVIYEIPYRSLLPRELENLWVAGRCIGATHTAFGSIRVMASCIAMGQGAGTAAAMAVRYGWSSRQVDTALLRKTLLEQGQYLLNAGMPDMVDERLIMSRERSDGSRACHYNPFEQEEAVES